MSRPPLAKEKIIDAYVSMLCEEGERAATMEATAAKAGFQKEDCSTTLPPRKSWPKV